MKKSNVKSNIIIASGVALVVVTGIAGVAMSSLATDSDTENRKQKHFFERNLTDSELVEFNKKRGEWRAEREAKKEIIRSAIESGNYQNFAEAVGQDAKILEKIDENNFSKLVEAHNLREQAKKIKEELGIKKGDCGGFDRQDSFRGFKKGFKTQNQ